MAGDTTTLTVGRGPRGFAGTTAGRLLVTLAVLAGAGVFVVPRYERSESRSPIAALVAASSPEARALEPRLSGGFPWAPFRPLTRAASQADRDLATAVDATLAKDRG